MVQTRREAATTRAGPEEQGLVKCLDTPHARQSGLGLLGFREGIAPIRRYRAGASATPLDAMNDSRPVTSRGAAGIGRKMEAGEHAAAGGGRRRADDAAVEAGRGAGPRLPPEVLTMIIRLLVPGSAGAAAFVASGSQFFEAAAGVF
ncbi:hypothetical protein CSOJ01_14918 [Colletotrichum sojae]|uniref:Uncharacterized protein n=1 Tax=Colletotrichum sojae TaxID=2175907 RepID=A0A8H6IP80_9PEZI|nr:hypothetical protein CSOJ01_14918 [Colletotrichum sojae]